MTVKRLPEERQEDAGLSLNGLVEPETCFVLEKESINDKSVVSKEARPTGRKKAKILFDEQKIEQRRAAALETIDSAVTKKNEILAEHTNALKTANDLKLLTIPEYSIDEVSLQILKLKKAEISREMQNKK